MTRHVLHTQSVRLTEYSLMAYGQNRCASASQTTRVEEERGGVASHNIEHRHKKHHTTRAHRSLLIIGFLGGQSIKHIDFGHKGVVRGLQRWRLLFRFPFLCGRCNVDVWCEVDR